MYSRIPMPQIEWKKENINAALCFFPLVGAVVGMLEWLWFLLNTLVSFGQILFAAVMVLIPVLVTGGIHIDGMMDTADALGSHASKEKKLAIMKDSHAGAMAILCCVIYMLVLFGLYAGVNAGIIGIICLGFVLSRCLSGLGVVAFACAKDSGLAATFADAAHRGRCRLTLMIEACAVSVIMIVTAPLCGVCAVLAAWIWLLIYYFLTKKQFGGITGDTQGFYLQICELLIAAAAIVLQTFV